MKPGHARQRIKDHCGIIALNKILEETHAPLEFFQHVKGESVNWNLSMILREMERIIVRENKELEERSARNERANRRNQESSEDGESHHVIPGPRPMRIKLSGLGGRGHCWTRVEPRHNSRQRQRLIRSDRHGLQGKDERGTIESAFNSKLTDIRERAKTVKTQPHADRKLNCRSTKASMT